MKKLTILLSFPLIANLLYSNRTEAQVDLTLANGSMNYNSATHEISITIDVKNIGSADVGFGTGALVWCYLSVDTIVDNNDYDFYSFGLSYGILGNASFNAVAQNVDLTKYSIAPSGKYFVLVKADYSNVISETNENNNTANLGQIDYTAGTGTTITIENSFNGNNFLKQNYPNPAINETTLRFFLKDAKQTTVKVFDLSGKIIYNSDNVLMLVGDNEIKINTSHLSSGIYYYNISTEVEQINGKFEVIK